MTENFGDFVKDKHHYHDDPSTFAYKGSKYLSRAMQAAQKALPEPGGVLKPKVDKMEELSRGLLAVRKSLDNSETKGGKAIELIRKTFPKETESLSPEKIMNFLFEEVENLVIDVNSVVLRDLALI